MASRITTITTPAGRSITFTAAAAANVAETGMSGQIDTDVDQIKNGSSLAAVLGACQEGADPDRLIGWDDYVAAVAAIADGEMIEGSR